MSENKMGGKIEFGSWEDSGKIYSAIRFPIMGDGEMLIQVCMPPKQVAGAPAQSISRLALGIPLGALGAQDIVEGEAKESAACVNACLEALSKSKEDATVLEALKASSDAGIQKALKFLGL